MLLYHESIERDRRIWNSITFPRPEQLCAFACTAGLDGNVDNNTYLDFADDLVLVNIRKALDSGLAQYVAEVYPTAC